MSVELVVIMPLDDLRLIQTDPVNPAPDFKYTVLAIHAATKRAQLLVEAADDTGLNRFRRLAPSAAVVIGDGTPDNHEEWTQTAYPADIQQQTSPVEILKKGKQRDRGRRPIIRP